MISEISEIRQNDTPRLIQRNYLFSFYNCYNAVFEKKKKKNDVLSHLSNNDSQVLFSIIKVENLPDERDLRKFRKTSLPEFDYFEQKNVSLPVL